MAYIGNTSLTTNVQPATDFFSGNGSTVSFTLSRTVVSAFTIEAVINNVQQHPTNAYTVSGNTITFTSAPPTGVNNIYVNYNSIQGQVVGIGQGTVGPSQLTTGAPAWNVNGNTTVSGNLTAAGNVVTNTIAPASGTLTVGGTGSISIPVGTTAQRPVSPVNGMIRKNSTTGYLEYWDPESASWKGIGVADGSSFNAAAASATSIKTLTGTTVDGVYWINLPSLGPTQVYCDMNTDGGGWMMLGYAGSVSGVGNSSHIVFHTIGNIATTRSYGQTSFSRFDIARQISGASANSQLMWRRTNNSNVIMIHSANELFNRMPGGPSGSNLNMTGTGAGWPITTMKLSNTGPSGLQTKTNGRYESGPGYPGIAWNSSYDDNRDGVGSISTFLVRRSLIYWETNGPQSQGQWFHASPLEMGPSISPTTGQSRLDIEVYFRV